MRTKSYFAETVEAAMKEARQDLGAEAVMLRRRKPAPEDEHLGSYEVVFGAPDQEPPASAPAALPSGQALGASLETSLLRELSDLRRQFTMLHRSVAGNAACWPETYTCLLDADFCPRVAAEVVETMPARIGAGTASSARATVAAYLRERIVTAPQLGRAGFDRKVVALVGPPGAGKTSMLVKLAMQFGLRASLPCQFLSTDTYRVGAADELRAYASILGVGMQTVDTVGALSQALEEHRSKGCILIDTPGYGPRDIDSARDLARFLARHDEIDVHLVLSACLKNADMESVVDRYRQFGCNKLIFTHLDETASEGALLSQTLRSRLPVSFLGVGQEIPEDLQTASLERLLRCLLAPGESALNAA